MMPEAKIIALDPGRQQMVNLLEHLLDQAKLGELDALAVVTLLKDGCVGTGVFERANKQRIHEMLGGIEITKFRLLHLMEW